MMLWPASFRGHSETTHVSRPNWLIYYVIADLAVTTCGFDLLAVLFVSRPDKDSSAASLPRRIVADIQSNQRLVGGSLEVIACIRRARASRILRTSCLRRREIIERTL